MAGEGFDAALCNLGESDEGGMALSPVSVLQQRRQQRGGQGHEGFPSQRQRDPVQALLAEAVAVALPLALKLVAVCLMPFWVILHQPSPHP